MRVGRIVVTCRRISWERKDYLGVRYDDSRCGLQPRATDPAKHCSGSMSKLPGLVTRERGGWYKGLSIWDGIHVLTSFGAVAGRLSGLSANGSLAVVIRSRNAIEDCNVFLKLSRYFLIARREKHSRRCGGGGIEVVRLWGRMFITGQCTRVKAGMGQHRVIAGINRYVRKVD